MHGIIIAGTHSGCGKTTVTLGLLAALRKKGLTVQPFKTGPDFIDTGLHKVVTGRASRNLDLWMCGEDYVRDCYQRYSTDADVSVVEGVMGLYDGNLSTAHLAAALNLPILLVVDAYGMAESAGAVVRGFREYRDSCPSSVSVSGKNNSFQITNNGHDSRVIGVIFNRVASENHFNRLEAAVHDIPVLGYLPRDLDFEIPHRHLGLTVAEEEPVTAENMDKLADTVLKYVDVGEIIKGSGIKKCHTNHITPCPLPLAPLIRIAVAYDKAFCFYYEDNLDLLRDKGAEIIAFSPLEDRKIPDADAVYIGGGYPELYAGQLANNKPVLASLKEFLYKGLPVYGECGGFMYLTEGIFDFDEVFYPMVGAFPLKTKMTKKRAKLGYRELTLKQDSIIGKKGTICRGHEFHYSEIVNGDQCSAVSDQQLIYSVKDGAGNFFPDEGYQVRKTLGSYIHIHFGSNPDIVENFIMFVNQCINDRSTRNF